MNDYGLWEFDICLKANGLISIPTDMMIRYDTENACFRGYDWTAPCKLKLDKHYEIKFTGGTLMIKEENDENYKNIPIKYNDKEENPIVKSVLDIAHKLIVKENKAQNGGDIVRLNYFNGIIKGLSLVIEPLGTSLDTNCVFIPYTSMEYDLKGRQWGLSIKTLV